MLTRESLSEKYDELYDKASELLKKFNPCKIENGTCFQYREALKKYEERSLRNPQYFPPEDIKAATKHYNFCCGGCKHLGPNGCMVKALYCRTWLCSSLRSDMLPMELKVGLTLIYDEAQKYHLLLFRGSKEESLRQAYTHYLWNEPHAVH